jgi:hypothetical protein
VVRLLSARLAAWFATALSIAAVLAIVGGAAVLSTASPAAAEERPRTLFQLLFPDRREEARPRAREPEARTPPRNVKRVTPRAERPKSATAAASAAAREPESAPASKQDDARPLLVVGDFLAGGLAEGLETVYRDDPTVRIVDRSNGSSGFVRDDYYDWPDEISAILDEVQPAVVVVMLGSNDRQSMRVGGAVESVRSDRWDAEYEARVTLFAAEIASSGVPLVWVGLPPFRFAKMSSDMIAFNDMQRRASEAAGGVFIDIWDGFADENGAFVTEGPDINGQPVRLRASDGINLTAAGKRKIAFYAEKPLARILADGAAVAAPESGSGEMFGPPIPGVAPVIERMPPVSLLDPALDGGDELLGLVVEPRRANASTPAQKLVIEGIAPEPMPGRVDDFGRSELPQAADVAAKETTSAIDPSTADVIRIARPD